MHESVSVDLKHAVTKKSISLSMADGMSEKQQNLQLEKKVRTSKSCIRLPAGFI